jgi:hypothetical protein
VASEPDSLFANEGDGDEVERLEERRKLLQRRSSGWLDELADLPSSLRAPVRQRLEEAATELEQIESRIALLNANAARARSNAVSLRELVATNLPAVLANATPDEKHKLVSLVIERAAVVEPRKGRRVDGRIGAGRGRDIEITWRDYV